MSNMLQTIIIALAVLAGAYLISTRQVVIKDASSHPTTAAGVTMNSINVQGEGKIYAQPDVFLLNISSNNLGDTTAEAQQKTKQVTDQLVQLAKSAGVADKDIQTVELQIYPEYEYQPNGTSKIKGYRATHGLALKIRKLDQVDELIGKLTFDNSIQVTNMSYDIDDKTPFYTQARKLAFEKAKQKATELAQLANISLDTPLSISDQVVSSSFYPPVMYQANVMRAEVAVDSSAGGASSVNPGQLEISVQVNVVYGVK